MSNYLLSHKINAVPSAFTGFTSLFGMEKGSSTVVIITLDNQLIMVT